VGLPDTAARDGNAIIEAACSGVIDALVVGGVDPADLGHPGIEEALAKTFVVSLEVRESAVTEVADVVLPVAPHAEKSGAFVNWEGRVRPFDDALQSNAMSDHRVLDMLAAELGVYLETRTQEQIHDQFTALGPWTGDRGVGTGAAASPDAASVGRGGFVLATWPTLLDAGRLQDGEPFLAGTAPRAVARLSVADAERLGVVDGDTVTVSSATGAVTVPALLTEAMVEGVVWLPTNSLGCAVRSQLRENAGGRVEVEPAPDAVERRVPNLASSSAATSYANTAPVARKVPPESAGFDKGLPQ
jgi:NADH-quinone oxidoreductase subunit G